ncbi:HNH endonuclease [Lentzea chajnantorensis]
MSGRWQGSTSAAELPPDWEWRREQTRRRAGGQCEHHGPTGRRCWRTGAHCDHIVPRSQGGSHALRNLQWLCHTHHARKTGEEAAQARAAISARRFRTPEPPPRRTTRE